MNKIIKYIGILLVNINVFSTYGQFSPQYPLEGHNAIHRSDVRIKAWATGIEVQRGLMDVADSSLGFASAGTPENALGPYDATIVSLGDGGIATLTFSAPIFDGDGPDFAVFENVFANPENDSLAFLELAFVEVSTDGERFVRFPAICNYQTDSQIISETYLEAHLIHNFAGKHVASAGTPFDLNELKDSIGIDINNINYVRIIDVIGTLNEQYATYDSRGMIINNPYPSPYPTSGFDLESVAVLNTTVTSINNYQNPTVSIYPNPVVDRLFVSLKDNAVKTVFLYNLFGELLIKENISNQFSIDMDNYPTGLYILQIENDAYKIIKK